MIIQLVQERVEGLHFGIKKANVTLISAAGNGGAATEKLVNAALAANKKKKDAAWASVSLTGFLSMKHRLLLHIFF